MEKAATLSTLMNLAALRDAVHQAEIVDIDSVRSNSDDLQFAIIAIYVAIGYSKDEALMSYNQSCSRVGAQINQVVKESVNGQ